ncbi:MAG: PIN domain-containing protein [Candidatus Micrarchaeota archaeon]
MIFLDSSFLISVFAQDEENTPKSIQLLREQTEHGIITDHIFEEVVTWLMKHRNPGIAFDAGRHMLENKRIDVLFVDRQKIEIALEIMKKYGGLSLCDSLSVLVMKENGISKILSYDSDFDRFRGIERLH